MVDLILNLAKKRLKRRLLAALFLVFFVGELGSHMAICVNHANFDHASISSSKDGHDDPCKYLVLCGNGTRRDQQVPNFTHDLAQQNISLGPVSDFCPLGEVREQPRLGFPETSRLFRPTSPPFHPPELS